MTEQTELIHTFNGIPFSTRVSKELLQSLDTYEAREDDVLLVSYPKSGTHWLTEIMKNLYHSHNEDNGVSKVTLTSPLEFGDLSKFDELRNLPNKRLIPTHLNYEMIPVQFKTKKCKMIYVIRNPKDTAVSLYHYYKQNPNLPKIEKWSSFLEMFLKGEGEVHLLYYCSNILYCETHINVVIHNSVLYLDYIIMYCIFLLQLCVVLGLIMSLAGKRIKLMKMSLFCTMSP
ncbi:sulfotransferase 6B1-like isoform X1 [Huso huso]|uniref:Sulfotransferase n=1 Tax=Huso huso TaxID=61971 RepID=A0ABR0ZT55_HUSHU